MAEEQDKLGNVTTTEGAERRRDLEMLLGTVVEVSDDGDDGLMLAYADGRTVGVSGIGYDGMWQYVIVVASHTEERG